ncbi:Abi family protein [Aliarcobacter butzleri]|uniref:Abi family protein n=1 Tax=Aliarcobacter butzleri TaxID=28197 RepID=UPI001EDBD2EF|nr:Abi family protein [Aliarcobacter butzleri]MCG3661509.1 Abi family protein [Aliarcobacter butzleri]MCG3679566.1 Abi family protein [Aliarcobacter butzleri]MDN5093350.1 Abi family protein [Aliarcobacter butzleri]
MSYTIYNKPFKNEYDLILFLKSKNLVINNESKAQKLLKNISYYRFKSYMHPFKNTSKMFNGTISFEDIEQLYRFDDELRDTFFTIIGRIEVKIRSKLNYVINNCTNDPFWYLNKDLFSNDKTHENILRNISSSFLNSNADYINHYKINYMNDKNPIFKHLPPFWIVAEIIMFGELLTIYKNLDKKKFDYSGGNTLDDLAKEFGAVNLKELNNWLILIKAIRNDCAHHSRVWNNNYFSPGHLVNRHRLSIAPINSNRIYTFFVILNIISKNLNLDGMNVFQEIKKLILKYPFFDINKDKSGFPSNWDTDPFWI